MTTPATVRSALHVVHRWLGLTIGTLFVCISISGSLLLFQPQLFEWAHGEMIPQPTSARIGSIDRWIENARAAVPQLRGPIVLWAPHVSHNMSDAGMMIFDNDKPGGFGNMGYVAVLVEPASGAVLGTLDVDRSPAYAPVFLHSALWAGEAGETVLAVMAVGVLLMLAIGMYLWWPSRGPVVRKLSPRPWRALVTNARRLHDWLGVWMLSLMLVLVVTGLYTLRPSWLSPALSLLPESAEGHTLDDPARACASRIDLDAAIARAEALAPGAEFASLNPHGKPARRQWQLTFQERGSGARHRQIHVLADLECGTVALSDAPDTRAPRDSVESWLVGLHDGTAFDRPGQILVAIIGLAPLVLLWSGVRVWLRRRRGTIAT